MPRSPRVEVLVDWDAVKLDSVEFARHLLKTPTGDPLLPTPAQQEILRGIQPWTTCVTGRQFGKSTVMGADAAWFASTHANRTVMVVGPSLEQSKIIFSEILAYFRQAPLKYLVAGKPKENPFPELRLKNGTVLMARGANSPQYIRGNRVHRAYVDEAAYIKDKVITDAIEPMFSVTGKEPDSALILISTPFGRGAFYDYFQLGRSEDPLYASFQYTSFDNPHADRTRLERIRDRYGESSLLWRTEYLGIFDTDDRAVFPWADIKWATENWTHGDEVTLAPQEDHRYLQGVDLANRSDFFVASVLDDTNPAAVEMARMDRYQKKGYPFYKARIRANAESYNIGRNRTLVDATSLGEAVVQDLADIEAEGYAFTGSAAKYEVVQDLARMLAEHRLRLPPVRDLIDELKYFEYEITESKRLKMEAAQGHDDIVMSLALAARLAAIPRRLGLMRAATVPGALPTSRRAAPKPPHSLSAPVADPWAALFAEELDESDRADAERSRRVGR